MSSRDPFEKALVGRAGEHYVLYRLYRFGLLASLAPLGSPTVDILVLSADEQVVATIQVRARTQVGRGGYGSDRSWPMKEKHEGIVHADFEPNPPVTYIVPGATVADVLKKSHAAWLSTPGARGQAHRDSDMRRICPRTRIRSPAMRPTGWTSTAKTGIRFDKLPRQQRPVLDDRCRPAYACPMRRLPLIVGAAAVVVLVILAFEWLMGFVGVFFAPFALLGLLLELLVFLGFVALVTWVVANVWKSVMRR